MIASYYGACIAHLISTVRQNRGLVIHSPTASSANADAVTEKRQDWSRGSSGGGARSRPTYFGAQDSFGADSWGSAIADEVCPTESDIVLAGRAVASGLEGTGLGATIDERGIRTVILLGFLSDTQILETAIDLTNEHPGVDVVVCSDGCASTPERHLGAMRKVCELESMHASVH